MARGGRGPPSSGYEKVDAWGDYYQAVDDLKHGQFDQALARLFKASTVLKNEELIIRQIFEVHFQRIMNHLRTGTEIVPRKELMDWENYFDKLDPKVLTSYSSKIADVYHAIFLHLQQIDDPAALSIIKKAREFNNDAYEVELFQSDAKYGDGDECLRLFDMRPEIFGSDEGYLTTVHKICMRKARDPRITDGKRFAEKAMNLDYVTIDSTLDLCGYFSSNKMLSDVKRALLRHLKRFPGDPVIAFRLGFFEYVNRNYTDSMKILEEMKRESGHLNIEVLYGLGLNHEALGNERAALAEYEHVVSHPQFCSLFFQDFLKKFPSKLLQDRLDEKVKRAREEGARRIKEAGIERNPFQKGLFDQHSKEYWSGFER